MKLEELDQKTRTLMTRYGAHHPKADIERQYLQRSRARSNKTGRLCASTSEQPGEVPHTSKEKILKEVSRSRIIENNKYGKIKEEIYKKDRENYKGKPLHGQVRKVNKEVRSKRSWDWLKKGHLKKETESTSVAAQDQVLCTRNLRNMVYEENVKSICCV